jgi:hypothetical protein
MISLSSALFRSLATRMLVRCFPALILLITLLQVRRVEMDKEKKTGFQYSMQDIGKIEDIYLSIIR